MRATKTSAEGALPLSRLRGDALDAWRTAVRAASPAGSVEDFLDNRPELRSSLDHTFVLATGKAAAGMARGVGPAARGAVLLPDGVEASGLGPGLRLYRGGHPLPNREGLEASRDILAAVSALKRDDRLLYLVSGGTSALFEVPDADVEVDDLITAYALLLGSGAAIAEINLIRRALSGLKGGGLARAAYPASVLTLAISDVAGDDPASIGSGPTVAANDSAGAALEALRRIGLEERLPPALLSRLAGSGRAVASASAQPSRVEGYHVVASVAVSEDAACERLEQLGYELVAPPWSELEGDAFEAGMAIAAALQRRLQRSQGAVAFVVGGETTVRLPERPGDGGRNQHLAAVLAAALAGQSGFACMVGGSDGRDGTSAAAGGLIDGSTAERAREAGYDLRAALTAFDTGRALAAAGDAICTGPTGTNVGDVLVATICTPRR